VKLNPHGTAPIYSTFVPVGDTPTSIHVDSVGNAELTVMTDVNSPAAISTLQFSSAGNQVANLVSTPLDRLHLTDPTLVPDGAGNILVTGASVPADLPITPGASNKGDNFVAVLRASDGAPLYSSRLPGGAGGVGIVPDGSGGFIVLGATSKSCYDQTLPEVTCTLRAPSSVLTRFTLLPQHRPAILGIANVSARTVSWGLAPGEIMSPQSSRSK
jgi:hypothetical protein